MTTAELLAEGRRHAPRVGRCMGGSMAHSLVCASCQADSWVAANLGRLLDALEIVGSQNAASQRQNAALQRQLADLQAQVVAAMSSAGPDVGEEERAG